MEAPPAMTWSFLTPASPLLFPPAPPDKSSLAGVATASEYVGLLSFLPSKVGDVDSDPASDPTRERPSPLSLAAREWCADSVPSPKP